MLKGKEIINEIGDDKELSSDGDTCWGTDRIMDGTESFWGIFSLSLIERRRKPNQRTLGRSAR